MPYWRCTTADIFLNRSRERLFAPAPRSHGTHHAHLGFRVRPAGQANRDHPQKPSVSCRHSASAMRHALMVVVMTEPNDAQRLAELADLIRAEHQGAEVAAKRGLQHALKA